MTVRHYSWEDVGAPVVPNTSGQRLIDNLRLVLKACLVDGYGDKPGAGWTMVHDHADGFSLSNGNGVINFVSIQPVSVQIYIMESITDGSAALAEGVNRRSGGWYDGQTSSNRQMVYHVYFTSTYTNKAWYVVADDRTACLVTGGNYTSVNPSSANQFIPLYFGEFITALDTPGFCALGGAFTAGTSNNPNSIFSPAYTPVGGALRNPLTGEMGNGIDEMYAGAAYGVQSTINTNKYAPRVNRLNVYRVGLRAVGVAFTGHASDVTRAATVGTLRGVVSCLELADITVDRVLSALGNDSPVWQDRFRPMTLPGGDQWLLVTTTSVDLNAFVSLNPADWE